MRKTKRTKEQPLEPSLVVLSAKSAAGPSLTTSASRTRRLNRKRRGSSEIAWRRWANEAEHALQAEVAGCEAQTRLLGRGRSGKNRRSSETSRRCYGSAGADRWPRLPARGGVCSWRDRASPNSPWTMPLLRMEPSVDEGRPHQSFQAGVCAVRRCLWPPYPNSAALGAVAERHCCSGAAHFEKIGHVCGRDERPVAVAQISLEPLPLAEVEKVSQRDSSRC